jgi:cytochrome c oxidase subunit II
MTKLLIFIAIVAGVAALIQLIRLNEVAAKVRGERSEEIVTEEENNLMAYLWIVFMLAFYGFTIWLMVKYQYGGLGPAASVHGEDMDWLLRLNYWIILPVFFLTNSLLFIFSFKYRYNKNRKAEYFAHSNKLEMIWTVVPSTVLAIIIFMGLKTWKKTMFDDPAADGVQIVEVYAQQFGWSFRLAGEDNILGDSDFKLITGASTFVNAKGEKDSITANALGVVTQNFILAKYAEIDRAIESIDNNLEGAKNVNGEYYVPDAIVAEWLDSRERLVRQRYRIASGIEQKLTPEQEAAASNDVYVADDLYLIVGKPVTFKMRSKDVIHSMWLPHFRAQMNCVPGIVTSFTFTPKYTTKEFAEIPEVKEHYKNINLIHNDRLRSLGIEEEVVDFNFILLCNKICGAGHHNMQRKIVVVTEDEYEKWVECVDFKEANPIQPRIDLNGNPVVYWGAGRDAENIAVKNQKTAAETVVEEVVEEAVVVEEVLEEELPNNE